jgi:hypothetical protein
LFLHIGAVHSGLTPCRRGTVRANMRIGLVLGAGGIVGGSWLIGALDALES